MPRPTARPDLCAAAWAAFSEVIRTTIRMGSDGRQGGRLRCLEPLDRLGNFFSGQAAGLFGGRPRAEVAAFGPLDVRRDDAGEDALRFFADRFFAMHQEARAVRRPRFLFWRGQFCLSIVERPALAHNSEMSTIRGMANDIQSIASRGQPPAHPFRGAVLRGLAVLCPPLLTVLIIVWAISTTKSYFLEPVTGLGPAKGSCGCIADVARHPRSGRQSALPSARQRHVHPDIGLREGVRRGKRSGEPLPTTGEGFYRRYVDLTYLRPYYAIPFFLAVFILLLYFLGKFMAAGIGGFFGNLFERAVLRVPGVRAVYSAVKQVSDFVFTEREIKFTRIVAVEYPRKGIWSMGFVTSESLAAIHDAAGRTGVGRADSLFAPAGDRLHDHRAKERMHRSEHHLRPGVPVHRQLRRRRSAPAGLAREGRD